MNQPLPPVVVASDRKAELVLRRSPLVWPESPFRGWDETVRFEARVALRETLPEYWRRYRTTIDPVDRARLRTYLRTKIAAIRLLRLCA